MIVWFVQEIRWGGEHYKKNFNDCGLYYDVTDEPDGRTITGIIMCSPHYDMLKFYNNHTVLSCTQFIRDET